MSGEDSAAIEVRGDYASERLSDLMLAIHLAEAQLRAVARGEESATPPPPTRWIVAEDFVAEVVSAGGGEGFGTDRLGGMVAAKTMAWPNDAGERVIVVNGSLLLDADEPRSLADHVFLYAHEFSHVVQDHIRRESGVMDGVPIPSETLGQALRTVVRIAVDEYRADLIALAVVGAVVTVTDEVGTARQAEVRDTFAVHQLDGAENAIVRLHPELPDLVQSYRIHRFTLDDFLVRLRRSTEGLLTLLAHWQASCDALEIESPWDLGGIPAAPATDLYLRPLWQPVYDEFRGLPLLLAPDDYRKSEPALLTIGAAAVENLWATLGVTVEVLADGSEYVHVGEPAR